MRCVCVYVCELVCICECESVISLIPHFFKNKIIHLASALTNLRQLLFNIKAATHVNDKNYAASGVSLAGKASNAECRIYKTGMSLNP